MSSHFNDKTFHCDRCDKDIFIPHNQVGGFWTLRGWTNPHGIQFSGGYCSPCFSALDNILPNDKRFLRRVGGKPAVYTKSS